MTCRAAPASLHIALIAPPPYHTEPIKRVLTTLESQRRDGDSVYVFYGAVPAVDVYVDQLGLDRAVYYAGDAIAVTIVDICASWTLSGVTTDSGSL